MTTFLSDIILGNANDIQFQTTAGTNAGKISQVGDDLVLSNAVGDILLGNGSDDIFIGDGTNTVDIRFEQDMAIFADSSSTRTLTLGGNNTNLVLESPTLNSATFGATTINNKLTFTTSNGYIVFDHEPANDTGEYSSEVPLIKVDHNGTEKTILSRISENGAIQLGHDDTVLITAGDVGDVMKTNWGATNEQVVLAAEGGFYAYGFPNNDTTWSNRNEFRFRSDSTTASDNGLYIGDGSNTQFIDLSRNLKNIGTISSGAISSGDITISDTSPTLKLTDTDHNDDWSIANNNGDFRIYNETDGLAYLIADEDNVSVNIGDGVNVTYDGISGGNVQSGVQTTGNSGTVVRGGFLNPASEANMVHIPHMINDLAGFNRWSNGTIVTSGFYQTRSGSAGSYSYSNEITNTNAGWANAFDAHSSTAGSWYSDNGTDGVYTHGVDTPGTVELQWPNEITYSLVVGIVFGANSFTATYVKIEAYKGDGSGNFAWQTLCEITNNTDQVILRRVANNLGTGEATKRLKYTLGGSVNGSYFRIHSLYMTNYAAGNNNLNGTGTDTTRGVNFLERYKDGFLHGSLYPGADDTHDLGSNSYKWKNSYFDGVVYSDRVHSQGNFPQYNIVDDPNGGGSSRTMQLGMSGTSLYFKKSDATGNVFFRNTNNTDLMTIGLADSGQVTVLNELEAGSLDINGNADISGATTTSGNITATANNATISAAESGGATTKIMGASVGRVGTSSNHNLEILSNNTAAITVDTSQNVGIGVSPTNTLDVRGAASVNGTTLGIDNTYGESPKILQFTYNGNIPVAKVIGFGRHSTGNLPYFAIEVNDTTSSAASTSTVERLRITNEGRVGIGTDTPSQKLEVSGNIKATDSVGPYLNLYRSDNVIASGNHLGSIVFGGGPEAYPDSPLDDAAIVLKAQAAGTAAAGDSPSRLIIQGIVDGSAALSDWVTLEDSNATFAGNIVASSSSAVIQTPRVSIEADGTIDWGQSRDYGTLTWDSGKIMIRALSGNAMELQTNGSTTALTLDTSQNATFAGDVKTDKLRGNTYSDNSFLDFDDDQDSPGINMTSLASIARINYLADTNGNDGATAVGHAFMTGTTDVDTATSLLTILNNGSTTIFGALTIGADDSGHDVIFYGATSGKYMQWDESNDYLNFRDGTKIMLGNSNDLQLSHNGTDSYIENVVGHLYIKNTADEKDIVFQVDDGNGSFTDYIRLDSSADNTKIYKDLRYQDNVKAKFGAVGDLEIYHDGSNSYIDDTGTGNLKIRSNRLQLEKYTGETMAEFIADGSSSLYYNNVKKFETTSSGVDVTGAISITDDGGASMTIDGNEVFTTNSNLNIKASGQVKLQPNETTALSALTNGNVLIGTTTDNNSRLRILGATSDSTKSALEIRDSSSSALFTVRNDGRIDTSGNLIVGGDATISGDVTADNITSTSNSGVASIYINSTRPTLGFTDTNSFTDANDIYLIRAGANILQFQYYDDSASSTTETFNITSTGNATFAGNIALGGTVDGVDIASRDGVLTSTTTTANAALPKTGGTMTGAITLPASNPTNANHATRKAYVDAQILARKESFILACSDETTDLTASSSTPKVTFRMPYAFTLTDVRATVTTAPTGSTIVVDVKKGGTSIFQTKVSLDAGSRSSFEATTPKVFASGASEVSFSNDDEVTVFLDQIGSSAAGKGLKVMLIGSQ